MASLLKVVGDVGECRGCGATIWWIKTRTGTAAPYTVAGVSHFADCPKSAEFRRKAVDRER